MDTSFTKLRLCSHKHCLTIHTFSPPLPETLYTGRLKLLAEASRLFSHVVFQLVVVGKTASSDCVLLGATKVEVGGC
jgi:hypothetical protein